MLLPYRFNIALVYQIYILYQIYRNDSQFLLLYMSWRKFICDYKAVRKLYCICYLIKRKKNTTPSEQFQYPIGICRNRDKIDTIKTHLYVPLVVNTSRSFPHSWLITGVITRLTRRVSLVEQELLTLPEHLSSPRFLMGFVLLDL
jgi:hypothetical protein